MAAKQVQSLFFSSLRSKFGETVSLTPVRAQGGAFLHKSMVSSLDMATQCGLLPIALVTDGSQVNINSYQLMGSDQGMPLSTCMIQHPVLPYEVLFLLHDANHLIKNVRNSFIVAKEFHFPKFDSSDGSLSFEQGVTKFAHLRTLYYSQKGTLASLAPKLTPKAIYPTSFECQHTHLAIAIFDDTTIAGLKMKNHIYGVQGTIEVLSMFSNLKWSKIVIDNVKHPRKGIHKRDPDSMPITSMDDGS